MAAVEVGLEDVHVRVEIPDVTAALLGLLLLVAPAALDGVVLLRVGIEMGAGEDDLFARRMEVATRRLADAGADAGEPPGGEVHDEHLVERIIALLLGLEDDLLCVRREVAFAGTDEAVRDRADILEMDGFLVLPVGRGLREGKKGSEIPHR